MTSQVYQIVTDRIIAMLKEGTIPWQKPWVAGIPKNLVSKKPYRGLNVFILSAVAQSEGYGSNYWVTYNQASSLGGQVRRGEHATPVIFWKWIETTDLGSGKETSYPILRYYNVFNIQQCDWPEDFKAPEVREIDFHPIAYCEAIVNDMPNRPTIKNRGMSAYYKARTDEVCLPVPESFENEASYYSVLFHELAHSTGHPKRLGRFEETHSESFGSIDYSEEELTAEMTAAMICGITGIENQTVERSAAYIKGWLQVLQDDVKFVIHAASRAQKAADYILGISFDHKEQEA